MAFSYVEGQKGKTMNKRMKELADAFVAVVTPPESPSLGLDLDGTISDSPEFFRLLSNMWTGKVYVITYRRDYEKAKEDVDSHGIKYEEIILVDEIDGKAEVIADKGISIYFDDQPEMLKNMPKNVQVMLVRNEGNFDFDDKKWTLSNFTGKLI